MMFYASFLSSLGTVTVTTNGTAVIAVGFSEAPSRGPRCALANDAADQLQAYFNGKLQHFDVPLAASGTAFQQRVWQALLAIPYGYTASYKDIASTLGDVNAVRAVGMANARNPIAIIVPCHRIIGSNGSLTGYAGGLEKKQWLLQLERR
jgi:methylated-DNA-[protein]-cysteine S-methyltransferase